LIYVANRSNIALMEIQGAQIRRRGRPSKRLDEQSDTREMLLRSGIAILTEKGFCATGIDEILRAVGIPKGSFYHYFDSKEAFGAELIDRYGAYFGRKLQRHFDNESVSHIERLKAFVLDACSGMAKYGYSRGCLIGNLGQEMGAIPVSYGERLSKVFEDWQERVAQCLVAAQATGEISVNINCKQQAVFFWIGWEGAVLRAKLERQPRPLVVFSEVFFAGLNK
jgi:TetR/AcrR family transcriptional repressor of nem operon